MCGLSLVKAGGATLACSVWASHCSGFSWCGAKALGTRASLLTAHGLNSLSFPAREWGLSSYGAGA